MVLKPHGASVGSTEASHNEVVGLEVWDRLVLEGYGFSGRADVMNALTVAGSDEVFDRFDTHIVFHDTSLDTLSRIDILI